ncbi:MAG: hypothetical protein Q8L60_14200 [Gammaproteobacteria bacterium]|nr:hypothetical protein [Gammaproteobacteria bacterium]MDP2139549.1 hypothetical protein [Gammaproteobacteria bacterium]MDP2346522.1 hypothetical protein [Gammaproteobacteria bacterium]
MKMSPGNDTSWHLSPRLAADVGMIVFLALFAAVILQNLLWTWDVVGYVGAAISWQEGDAVAIHTRTYQLLRSELPGSVYESLVAGPYASALAASPIEFHSQLDMYRIKPLYVGLLSLLGAAGFSLIDAGVVLSVVPAVLICALVYFWLRRHIPAHFALAITVLLSLTSRLFDVARVVLPDSLSALILVLAVFLLVERPSALRWSLLLLVISILVRTNNILFVAPLLAFALYSDHRSTGWQSLATKQKGITFVASIFVYLVVSAWFNHDWWRLFYHTFIGSIVDIDGFAIPFSLDLYVGVIRPRLTQIVVGGFVIVTVLLPFLVLSLLALLGSRGRSDLLRVIVLISYLNFMCYFFMFPLVEGWDRFFIPFYIFITVLAAKTAARSAERTTELQ